MDCTHMEKYGQRINFFVEGTIEGPKRLLLYRKKKGRRTNVIQVRFICDLGVTLSMTMKVSSAFVYLVLLYNCAFSEAFLESLFSGWHHGDKSNPDVVCIMEHCSSQSAACMGDENCRNNMVCMTKCGLTNHSCMYQCMNTYEDPIFDAMMKCLVDDFHCLDLPSPDPSFRCSPPKQLVKNFTMTQLEGAWWIVMGLNPDYDCFNCQLSTYKPMATSKNYTLVEKYDVGMLNGSIRHRTAIQQVQQTDPNNGGLLDYTNTIMGLTMYEKWQVLDYGASGNYMIVYYCGHLSPTWWYEGSLVYSRLAALSAVDLAAVNDYLQNVMGHKLTDYCKPNTWLCNI